MISVKEILLGFFLAMAVLSIIYAGYYKLIQNQPPSIASKSPSTQRANLSFSIEGQSIAKFIQTLSDKAPGTSQKVHANTPFYQGPITIQNLSRTQDKEGNRLLGHFLLAPPFEGEGKFDLFMSPKGAYVLDIDLLSAKINTKAINISRMSGKIGITKSPAVNEIAGNLYIGALKYNGLPFHGVHISMSQINNDVTVDLNAELSGHQGTELQSTGIFANARLQDLAGTLSIEKPQDFYNLLLTLATGSPPLNYPQLLKDRPYTLIFEETKNHQFHIRLKEKKQDFVARLVLSPKQKQMDLAWRLRNFKQNQYFNVYPEIKDFRILQSHAMLTLDRKENEQFGELERLP